ncbi:hypothetical protein PoB_001645000 [Plakobranchus ocellatus]|uniref:Uncharacterized protein n=1 Tax=Plakobranchus ocellatus TaxID=259542 RepID=A0AAV3Z3E3_9GAST|nr:hypothetical protein PoB_001645000 [Plakobranchus ocellatus]
MLTELLFRTHQRWWIQKPSPGKLSQPPSYPAVITHPFYSIIVRKEREAMQKIRWPRPVLKVTGHKVARGPPFSWILASVYLNCQFLFPCRSLS